MTRTQSIRVEPGTIETESRATFPGGGDALHHMPARRGSWLGAAVVSIAIHAACLLGLAAATWTFTRPGITEREYSVELTDSFAEPPAVGFQFAGKPDVATRETLPESAEGPTLSDLATVSASSDRAADVKPLQVAGGAGLEELAVGAIGGSDIVPVGRGRGSGQGDGAGLGERDITGGTSVGSLWGVGEGQAAKSVVYVMDRSGSMGDTFHTLQKELMRAIGSLGSDQQFNVIWFSEGRPTELFERLRWATPENKRDAFDAIKAVSPRGQTEPVEAARRALQYKPDVMYLLSDGDFGDQNAKLLNLIARMNREGRTTIHTILFVLDSMDAGERILRRIAETNRGTYKHVSDRTVGERESKRAP